MASRKKSTTPAGQHKDGIHFVNARPSSETEKLTAQRLVRAHVGQWISDQTTRDRSTASESVSTVAPPKATTAARAGPSFFPPSPPSRFSTSNSSASRKSDVREWQGSPFASSQFSDSSDSSDDTTLTEPTAIVPRRETSPIERPVSGYIDPFCTYPSQFPPEVVHLCESYCLSVVWPGITPSRPGNTSSTGETWFPLSLTDPALFTAFMFASLCHRRVQWLNDWIPRDEFGPQQHHLLQLCEVESIKLINQAIRDPTRATSDAFLLSVICMAHHQAQEDKLQLHRRTPFNPPLQRLQWVNVYGCLPPNIVHIQGLVQLVKMRGGLRNIKTVGIGPTLTFSDIQTSSVFCCHPIFEFMPLDESRDGESIQTILGFGLADIEQGFGRLHDIGVTPQMAEAFQAAHTYIHIAKSNMSGTTDQARLADQRNLTQYTLLSLLPANDLISYFSHPTQAPTYEACRLAGLIFGVGVIFPIPAQNTPLHDLAYKIQAVLRQPDSSTLWSSPNTRIPLIWILTLAAIAATDTPARAWFVSALGETTRRSGISSWPALKTVLEMMLWLDTACDDAANALWFEVDRAYVVD